VNLGRGCTFRSTVDNASDLRGPWDIPSGYAHATLRCNANGGIVRRRNVLSVSKTGTGTYVVTFDYPASSSSPQAVGSIVGGHGTVNIVAEAAGSVTVETKNATGTTVDLPFNLIVFDA